MSDQHIEENKTPTAAEIANAGIEEPASEPVEVELQTEDLTAAGVEVEQQQKTAAAAEGDEAEKKTKKRQPSERARLATARAAELQRENDELKRRLSSSVPAEKFAEIAERAQTADAAAMTHYENATKRALEIATRDLESAERDGDPAKKAAATAALAKASADQANIDSWKAQQPKPKPKSEPSETRTVDRQPQTREREEPRADPETQAWINDNPWFDPSSPEHNRSMFLTATAFGDKLERQYRREGKADLIGSKEYFDALDEHIRSEFPEEFEEAEPVQRRTPPMERGKTSVAPATRSAPAAPGSSSKSATKITLTPDQADMARRNFEAGNLGWPVGHPKAGQKAKTVSEAYTIAALAIAKDQRQYGANK